MQSSPNANSKISNPQQAITPPAAVYHAYLGATAQQPPDQRRDRTPTIGEIWMIILTGAIVLIAAVQAWIFWLQKKEMKTTSDILEKLKEQATNNTNEAQNTSKVLRLEQRAWLHLFDYPNGHAAPDNPMQGSICIRNSGKTAATQVKAWVRVETCSQGKFDRLPLGDNTDFVRISPTIFPDTRHWIEFSWKRGEKLSQRDWASISIREIEMFVYGTVFYRDVFKVQHHTMFCLIVDARDGTLKYYEKYNDIDQNE
jgi:hypothetical protein